LVAITERPLRFTTDSVQYVARGGTSALNRALCDARDHLAARCHHREIADHEHLRVARHAEVRRDDHTSSPIDWYVGPEQPSERRSSISGCPEHRFRHDPLAADAYRTG